MDTKKIFLIVLASVAMILQAYSQQKGAKEGDSIHLNEIVITGTPVKVNLNNVPMSVTVVNREKIDESNESNILPILNGNVPGLFVTERGITGFGVSTGAAGQITIRGIGGDPTNEVLILIDGHPQFMGIFGHPLSDSYVASNVERVEVIRGPASILYGSNAMGGVINIITRKQTLDGLHGDARAMLGSHNTQKYMADGGFKKDKFSVFTSVNHDQTDGYRSHSDFNITNGYLKLGYEINPHLHVNTDFSIARSKASDPGPDSINSPGSVQTITRGYWAFTLDQEYEKYSGAIKAFYNFGKHNFTDGFHSTDDNYGLSAHESVILFKGNDITFGADYTSYGGKAGNPGNATDDTTILNTSVYEVGIYGFVQQTFFERLTINAGLRLQNHKVYGKEWIPSGGFAFRIAGHTTWKASVSKGFRSPTLQELFLSAWYINNPDLKPERVMNYETGILQSFYGQKLNLELTGFIIKGNNLIVVSPPYYIYENNAEVSNKGIEFAANTNPLKNLSFNLTYSFISMKTPIFGTPKHHFYISGNYKWNKLKFTASLQQVNHLNTNSDASATPYFQNYKLLNARVSYQAAKFAEIFVSSENLLNQKYETLRAYPMPGITIFGGINVKF
jgi:outer membrane cobalamin receptor